MNKFKIAIDMDEVIVDLIGHWEMIYRIKANIPDNEEIIVKDWDMAKSFNKLPPADIYDMLDIPGMFKHCSPVPGAIDAITALRDDGRFEIDILTVAKAKTAYSEKLQWVEEHLGAALKNRTIGVCSGLFKAQLAKNYNVIIEDNHMTLKNVPVSSGCHRILFKRPHNYMAVCPVDFDDAVSDWGTLLHSLLGLCQEND